MRIVMMLKPIIKLLKQVDKNHATQARQSKKDELPVISVRESDDDWTIKKQSDRFIVSGKQLERFAARTRFGDGHSEDRLLDILHKRGVLRELERQGIEPGQTIQLGSDESQTLEY
jgi:Obg family GTPase CgtA-like protein